MTSAIPPLSSFGPSSVPSQIPPDLQNAFSSYLSQLAGIEPTYSNAFITMTESANTLVGDLNRLYDPNVDQATKDYILSILNNDAQAFAQAYAAWSPQATQYKNLVTLLQSSMLAITTLVATTPPPSTEPPFTNAPPFPWLSESAIQMLQSTPTSWPPESILNAFYSYTSLGTQVINQSVAVSTDVVTYYGVFQAYLAGTAALSDVDAAISTLRSDAQAANSLATQWSSYASTFANQMNDYMNSLAPSDPIRTVLIDMQSSVQEWATTVIQPLIDAAVAQSHAAYTTAQAADLLRLKEFYAHLAPPDLQAKMQEIGATYQARLARLTAEGISHPVSASMPTLLPSTSELSMKQLMEILGKVQMMILSLARLFATVDSRVSSLRTALSLLGLKTFSTQSAAWIEEVNSAAGTYNVNVDAENLQTYNSYVANYQIFKDNIPIINQVIGSVNLQIEDQNNRASLLASAANTIDQDAIASINAFLASIYPTTAEIYTYAYPYLTLGLTAAPANLPSAPSATIPPQIPLLSEVTSDDFPTLPPYAATETFDRDALDAFNQSILTLLEKVGPLLPDIISALKTSGAAPSDFSFTLPQLYLSRLAHLYESHYLSSLFTTIKGFLFGFILQLLLDRGGRTEIEKVLALLKGKLPGLIDISPELATSISTKTGLPTLMGFTVEQLMKPHGDVGHAINVLISEGAVQTVVSRSLERAGILAGLNVAGRMPTWVQSLSRVGISLTDALEEMSTTGAKAIEEETARSSYIAFAEQLASEAADEKSLRENAITLIANHPQLAGISQEAIHELMSSLVVVQQSFLLFVGTVAAMQAGMGLHEVLTQIMGIGGTESTDMLSYMQGGAMSTVEAIERETEVGGRDEIEGLLHELGLPDNVRSIAKGVIIAMKQLETVRETPKPTIAATEEPKPSPFAIPQPSPEKPEPREEEGAKVPPQVSAPARDKKALIDTLISDFRRLPPKVQKTVTSLPAVRKIATREVPVQTVAAVMVPVRLGLIQPQVGAALLSASVSDTITDAIHKLFTPTKQEQQIKEDERLAERRHEEVMLPVKHPAVVPVSLHNRLKEGYSLVFHNTSEAASVKKSFESFARTVKRLSDFNTVALNLLMDPAKTIIKQFSFLTHTTQDRGPQPPVVFTG